MFFTKTLMYYARRSPLPYRFRGKHRKQLRVTPQQMHELRKDFEREERNMQILRHPYLTTEQSHGHMVGSRNFIEKLVEWSGQRDQKFEKHTTFSDQLSHLKTKDCWD